MDRRSFLKAGVAGTAGLGAGVRGLPALAQGAGARTLRFVPQANLANFDPIWGTQYVVRNASALVWDTLYGLDETVEPRRQMVEAEEQSDGGRTWTFRLRPNLRFHDGEPVRARDVVASLNRWAVRDGMGQMIRAVQEELVAVDDRTFRWRLRQPYPKMLLALGKTNTPMAFIMPERLARTDPFQQLREVMGSGPYRFRPEEFIAGSGAAFERFGGYAPTPDNGAGLTAGPKVAHFDRVEWRIIPDAATAAAAMQANELDWYEQPPPEIQQLLARGRAISVEPMDPLPTYSEICWKGSVRAMRSGIMNAIGVLSLPSASSIFG